MNHTVFSTADIYLPNSDRCRMQAWPVIACDQHTSEPEYWKQAAEERAGSPSTLDLILPEVYLQDANTKISDIHKSMDAYLQDGTLVCYPNRMVLLERRLADGKIRLGLIGKIDLDAYDYSRGAHSLIRATEATVVERIPARVAVRRGAALELPHVLLLVDDPNKTLLEPLYADFACMESAYDTDLMLNGGRICGKFLTDGQVQRVNEALSVLSESTSGEAPLLFAVGDGNHSLASAKAYYEELKQEMTAEEARRHPARYALVEIVNLHSPALEFEPIFRVLYHVNPQDVLREWKAYTEGLKGTAAPQIVRYVGGAGEGETIIPHPTSQLPVGTLQMFLDSYLKANPEVRIDYIHGEDTLRNLASAPDRVGFLFHGMEKTQLFPTVIKDGALPRKTFSMGHAQDKRYYFECRKLK